MHLDSIPQKYIDRFWGRVQRTDGCWIFMGARHQFGYGTIYLGRAGGIQRTHRLAWELAAGGPISPGLSILHTCDVPACVRNDEAGIYTVNGVDYPRFGHLFLATAGVNSADMRAKGREARGDLVKAKHPQTADTHWSHRQPELVRRGEAHHSAKLTEAEVLEIRRLFATGELNQRQIAARIGVDHRIIWEVVHRHTWQYL